MKKVSLLAVLFSLCSLFSFAQKIGHINGQELIEHMPEYKTAYEELNLFKKQFEDQLLDMETKYKTMVADFEAKSKQPMNDLIKNADGEKEGEVRYWKTSGGTCAAIINESPLILDIELGGYEKLRTGGYIFDSYIPISITNIYQTQTVRLLRHFDVIVSDKLFEKFEKI
jgi:hypothetical protein